MNERTRLRRVYRQIPAMECKGLCQGACGPIAMTATEAKRIEDATGRALKMVRDDKRCGYLGEDGKCEVYAQRPLICRLWGADETLRCPHGCRPKKLLTREQGHALFQEMGEPSIIGTLPGYTEAMLKKRGGR